MAEEEAGDNDDVQELADFLEAQDEEAEDDNELEAAFIASLRRITGLTMAQAGLVTAQGITKANDLASLSDEAIEQIFQGRSAVARGVNILRKEKLKGLAQWIRNKYEGATDFTIGAARASDIDHILFTATNTGEGCG
jgi:hypothetical protein